MAWSRVTSASLHANVATPGSTSWNAGNLGAAITQNDVVIAFVTINHSASLLTANSMSDSTGMTWTKMLSKNGSASGVFLEASWWCAVRTASGSATPNSITVVLSGNPGSQGASISCQAYRGLSTAIDGSQIDLSLFANVGSGVGASGTAGTNTADNELCLGGYADWGSGGSITAGTGFSMAVNDSPNGNAESCIEDKDSGLTGTSQSAAVNGAGGTSTTGVLVYKLAGAAPSFDPSAVPWQAQDQPAMPFAVVGF